MANAAEGEDVHKRISEAADVFKQVMDAPDQGIPEWVLHRAHCAIIVPGLKAGGFIVGAKYGKGIMTCRDNTGGWTAPSAVRVEGGSVGFQIGVSETDAILFVMNQEGKEKLLKSEFTFGGSAAAVAGPVGRTAQAQTDALVNAQILSYSRARGAFAGVALEGGTLRADDSENKTLYGREIERQEILNGKVPVPAEATELIATLNKYSLDEK
jgi:lipid-binding SYLF domain-containing protein